MEIPFWWEEAPPDSSEASTPGKKCDVVVVGGGYTGLAAAIVLARAGKSVQLFDAIRPGEGASTRNGGIASGNLYTSISSAIATYGRKTAETLFREGHQARADLAAFVRDEKIDCDYQANGRFTGAINASQLEDQKREAGLLTEILGVDAYVVDRQNLHKEVETENYCGGAVREDLATIHPAKLHAGMLALARKAGVQIHGQTPVADYHRNRSVFEVTAGGHSIRSHHLVVATNGYTDGSDPWLRRRLVPVASRIVVTAELPETLMDRLLPKRRAMGETRKLFRYYRPTPDGKRILLGAREKSMRASASDNADHVFAGLVELFPDLAQYGYDYSWKGNVAFSRDEMPGLFEKDGAIYACGYCGSGVVWARWLGTKAAYKILGDERAATFFETTPPPAIPFFRGTPWFLPALLAYYRWSDWRARGKPV